MSRSECGSCRPRIIASATTSRNSTSACSKPSAGSVNTPRNDAPPVGAGTSSAAGARRAHDPPGGARSHPDRAARRQRAGLDDRRRRTSAWTAGAGDSADRVELRGPDRDLDLPRRPGAVVLRRHAGVRTTPRRAEPSGASPGIGASHFLASVAGAGLLLLSQGLIRRLDGAYYALRAVSDDWLTAKAVPEKGFSLGFFDEAYLSRFPVAVIERDGQIQAFANLWLGPQHVEASVNLMRFRRAAPSDVMEALFVYLMQWAKQQGYHWFALGMAPLSGFGRSGVAPAWNGLAHFSTSTARACTTSRACGRTKRSSIRCGSRTIWPIPGVAVAAHSGRRLGAGGRRIPPHVSQVRVPSRHVRDRAQIRARRRNARSAHARSLSPESRAIVLKGPVWAISGRSQRLGRTLAMYEDRAVNQRVGVRQLEACQEDAP